MKRKKGQAGFTLLEVIIAVTIISIGFMAVFSLHLETISVSTRVQFYTIAPRLAQKKLAELDLSGEGIAEESGDFGEAFPGYAWKASEEELTSETLGETMERFKKINLEVNLNEGENYYTVTAYRYTVPEEK